jgi:hypothetical protein
MAMASRVGARPIDYYIEGNVEQLGDPSADDDERSGLFIWDTEEGRSHAWFGVYPLDIRSTRGILALSNGGCLFTEGYANISNGGTPTASRQVRITGQNQWVGGYSQWDHQGNLIIDGVMTLSDGGNYSGSGDVTLVAGSKMYVHVSGSYANGNGTNLAISVGGMLDLNDGGSERVLYLCADMFVTGGIHEPVMSSNRLNSGVVAFGGLWDGGAKQFIVQDSVDPVPAGDTTDLNPSGRYVIVPPQRPLDHDGVHPKVDNVDLRPGKVEHEGLPDWTTTAALGVSTADFSVRGHQVNPSITAMSGGWLAHDDLFAKSEQLTAQKRPADLLAVWEIAVQNMDDDELYYSMDLGLGQEHLTLFMYVGGHWSEFSADILEWGTMTYDNDGVFGFVAPTSMTMFAVFGNNPESSLANVPEPATLTLLTIGGLAMLRRR